MGNIGAAALGAYGSAANSALGAWGANQTAYNSALADMTSANQQALSAYGANRSAALGNLGGAYAVAGKGLADASMYSDTSASMSDGGSGAGSAAFNATGVSGPLASGTYGGSGSAGGMGLQATKQSGGRPEQFAGPTFGGLGRLQSNLMERDVSDGLSSNYANGLGSLNSQHMSSRGQPAAMLQESLMGLRGLAGDAYGTAGRGMDQFYAAQGRGGTNQSAILDALTSGYAGAQSQLGGFAGGMGEGLIGTSAMMGQAYAGLQPQIASAARDMGTSYRNTARDMSAGNRDTQAQLGSFANTMGAGFNSTGNRLGSGYGAAMSQLGSGFNQTIGGISGGMDRASRGVMGMYDNFRNDSGRIARNMTNNPNMADMQEKWAIQDASDQRSRDQRALWNSQMLASYNRPQPVRRPARG